MKLLKLSPLLLLFLVLGIFFKPFILESRLPVPADTIVGMYHPWRDKIWDNLTAGVPFKNFLITDPVRQLYPWRNLVIESFKNGQLPFWNPYHLAGTPLLANFQSAVFYPFNLFFFILPFNLAWGWLIVSQPLLAGIFMYLYLRVLNLSRSACLLGSLVFSLSGFFIAWLEWGTVLHSALWLPLILLAIEKIISCSGGLENFKFQISNFKFWRWPLVFIFSLTASFFAGHLQTFFYVFLFSFIYLLWKLYRFKGDRLKLSLLLVIGYLLFVAISSVQWRPTLEFIGLSARGIDQADWQSPGWFIPWQNLAQFLAPDFFGNPATLNYWGVWNYGEFVGYIGIVPLLLALLAIFRRPKGVVGFFTLFGLLALTFALPTPWAKLPYELKLPLISTSQPTRLLFIVDFCLAVLAAFGLERLLTSRVKLKPVWFLAFGLGLLWLTALWLPQIAPELAANLAVSRRNLVLPTIILVGATGALKLTRWGRFSRWGGLSLLLLLTCFDLIRFGWKFTPFTKGEWIFPPTAAIEFLQKDKEVFRFMSTDRRIFPPNFSAAYGLQAVDGYDPLYLARYGELVAASERGRPDISPPLGFNRIITPQNFNSRIMDLLNIKYVLSLANLESPKLNLVFQEGETRIYRNKAFFPRAFMVYNHRFVESRQKAIELLMDEKIDLRQTVILEESPPADFPEPGSEKETGKVTIQSYQANEIVFEVESNQKGFLVFGDAYYPGWQATVGGRSVKIYQANYHLRAIIVPAGKHIITFAYGN